MNNPDDELTIEFISEIATKEPYCWKLHLQDEELFLVESTGVKRGMWLLFRVRQDGDELDICYVESKQQLEGMLRLLQCPSRIRESVLNERGPMAEMEFGCDRVNAVLGVIDDEVGEVPCLT